MDLASTDELRQRIAALEVDLQKAQAAKEEAESSLENHRSEQKHAEHARHAARNLASYGHNDKIIFVHPEDLDQGLIYRLSKGQGPSASVCRVMVRYNLDQFLKRPRLHQWLSAGKIYREAGEQQVFRFFRCNIFAAHHRLLIIACSRHVSSSFLIYYSSAWYTKSPRLPQRSQRALASRKYVLTFVPAFGIWADIRDIANQFSNDDVTQRAYILWISVLLVGYSNNASAIKFGATETGVEGAPEGGILTEDSFTAMRWTLGLFCLAKLSKVALQLVYALFLPLSRKPLIVSTLNSIPTAILFFIAIFTSLHVTIALVVVGLLLDYLLRVIGVLLYKNYGGIGAKV
ncbi:hypothetical protein MVEN_01782700 [Mycena venus]|uniref:Uncharacterized protein n=1 Tax=Mycena venus TaxID=2733690 RepID=A0A8H6XK54_9AGAR|nr:hypothetical protein MVEN_01782700 [Mycena venus]